MLLMQFRRYSSELKVTSSRLRQSPIDLRVRFNRKSSVYSAIEGLSATTDLEQLKTHALDPEDSAEQIAEVKRSLAMLQADVSNPLVALKSQARNALVEAGSLANAVRHLGNSSYNKKLRDPAGAKGGLRNHTSDALCRG